MLQQKAVHYWKSGKDVVLTVLYLTPIEAVISNVCRMPTDGNPTKKKGRNWWKLSEHERAAGHSYR